MTEDELKTRSFCITRLGRRKNIIRAINLLKANICRSINNGASMLHSQGDQDSGLQVNRSAGLIRPNLNRSNLGLGSIDRSVILSNAQSFFKTKGTSAAKQTRPNRFQYVNNLSTTNSFLNMPTGRKGSARSHFDGNLSFIA